MHVREVIERHYALVYNGPRAKVAHVADSAYDDAVCGELSPLGDWHGTGSQDEYDHAKYDLPVCARCEQALRTSYNLEGNDR